jgi:signal peptidase
MFAIRIPRRGVTSIRRLADAALIGLVAVVAATGVGSRLAPLLGAEAFSIRGGSMAPGIPLGAIVFVADGSVGIALGEVVAYRLDSGSVVTHRVVALVERDGADYLQTKGDANRAVDPDLVPVDAVIGQAVLALPFLGYLAFMLGEPMGILAILSAFVSLLLLVRLLEDVEWRMARGVLPAPHHQGASSRSARVAARLLAAHVAGARQRP